MLRNQRQKIVVIVGPTASGKSNLGIFLARKFGGEIISADSRQVYRGMDIGTGKITRKEHRSVKHYLLDVANPKNPPAGGFTVSDFQKAINDVRRRYKVPFVVGGTGFYIDTLVKDSSLPEVPPDKKLRAKLAKQSAERLFSDLLALDPRRAKTIDPKNKIRLIRALEIIKTTGKPVPALKESPKYKILYIGIKPSKSTLENRIKLRLEKRLRAGMIKEVKNLLKSGVSRKRLHDFGLEYHWVGDYLNNKITRQEMEAGLLRDIIKYSKRQMTWFKRNKKIHWIKNQKEAEKLVKKFISPLP